MNSCYNPVELARGLDHHANFSEEEHKNFKTAFQDFKEKTDFESEVGVWKLKYYVQMAFLEGWKAKVDTNKM